MSMIYTIKNLKHCYNGKTAFEADGLSISQASITGVNGPNGAGKSTLLNILALIQKPSSGTVLFKDKAVQPFSKSARSRITILSQNPYLLKRSVFNNVAYGLKTRNDKKNLKQRVYNALEAVGLDGNEFADRLSTELSGGESKRVALAARLILNPDVLILDEPTANVDAESSLLIRKAALDARDNQGTTLIISSHDKDWLYDVCDSVLNIFNGRIIEGKRISLIFGPWEKTGNALSLNLNKNLYIKSGYRLLVPEPPDKNSVAVFPADDFYIYNDKTKIPEKLEYIEGSIRTITMGKKCRTVFGTLKIKDSDLSVTVNLNNSRPESFIPAPGQAVFACYKPDLIKFA